MITINAPRIRQVNVILNGMLEGKVIQFKSSVAEETWKDVPYDVNGATLIENPYNFRIKPEYNPKMGDVFYLGGNSQSDAVVLLKDYKGNWIFGGNNGQPLCLWSDSPVHSTSIAQHLKDKGWVFSGKNILDKD